MERCDPPRCVRILGHDGDCWATWWGLPICGAQMPMIGSTCARHAGHKDTHRSRRSLDNDARRQQRWRERNAA